MTADELCNWLRDGRDSQRDKLVRLKQHYVPWIRELYDDDYTSVMRAIKKRLASPKLEAELDELLVLISDHPSNPRPLPGDPPKPPPVVPVGGDDLAQLVAAIEADPTLRDNYVVYGDWLESHGDPRGALVAIGAELAKASGNKAMLAAHAEHLRAHPDILGPLAECEDIVTNVEWFMGFIAKARVSYTMERFNHERPSLRVEDVVTWLLDGPGRFLQDLTLGMIRHDDMVYESTLMAIATKPRPLRRLHVGDFEQNECELNWANIGDCTKLWPMVQQLRELSLRAGGMTIGAIDLPRLETFSITTGGLDTDSLAYIAAAGWPSLHTLALQTGPEGTNDVKALLPLFAGARVPKLRTLGIANCGFTDAVVERLLDGALLAQLERLDLSMGTLSADGANLIVRNAPRFAHLELNVDECYVPDELREPLQRAVKHLTFGGQRDDGGDPTERQALFYE